MKEKTNLIFSAKKKPAVKQNDAKRLAHIFVIENTHLDSDKYCQVLDRIFDKRLAHSLKNKIESEIKGQQEGEFMQTFELFNY